jgi:nucleotide-binding universal stress UspA family protein
VTERAVQQENTRPSHAVVAAVDGSACGTRALRYAIAEATARHRPLRVVHVWGTPPSSGAIGIALPPAIIVDVRDAARAVLQEAQDVVRDSGFEGASDFVLVEGSAAHVLIGQSEDADLVVMGSRGLGGLGSLVLGSVSQQVASHASSPTVVLRDEQPGHPDDAARPSGLPDAAGRVVVGIDGSPASTDAVAFAFDHAALHHLGVLAVHAGERPRTDRRLSAEEDRQVQDGEQRVVSHSLAGYAEKYTDVALEEVTVPGSPAEALVAASRGAALVVVGSRGRGGFRSLLLGSTGHAVLHHAHAPVAVVRPVPSAVGG